MAMLGRDDILRGLSKIDVMAKEAEILIDLSIYGGAALALAFDIRQATRDVDAVVRGSPDFLRRSALVVALEEGWPEDWLNDGVKGFTSGKEQMRLMESFGASPAGGLRIHVPTPEYLFAMKCMSMRAEGIDGSHDISDIEALADIAGIKDAVSALTLVEAFYPSSRIPPKVRFGLEEIMERVALRRSQIEEANAPLSHEKAAPVCGVMDVVTDGSYSGKILDVDDGVVIQKIGRGGEAARHAVSALSRRVYEGEIVDITYVNGVGIVGGKEVNQVGIDLER